MTMRPLILITLVLVACSEDQPPSAAVPLEVFTLADGRVLTGTYDEAAGKLTIAGPLPASLRVAAKAIRERRPADAGEVAATTPKDWTPEEKANRTRNACRSAIGNLEDRSATREREIAREEVTVAGADRDRADLERAGAAATAEASGWQRQVDAVAAQRDELAQSRALFDADWQRVAHRDDEKDGDSAECEVIRQRLTAVDARLRQLETTSAAYAASRDQALRRAADIAGRQRTVERKMADATERIAGLRRSIAEDRQQIVGYRRRLAEVEADARAAASPPAADAQSRAR
jgi:predicted  nucleic acid-binding Zn-ribbon protein